MSAFLTHFTILLLLYVTNGDCDYDVEPINSVARQCGIKQFVPSIAIQLYPSTSFAQYASYSSISVLIQGNAGLNIIPHCVSIHSHDDGISSNLVRQWIFGIEPWPTHHERGNAITLNAHHNVSSQLILTFNNPCVIDHEESSAHVVILVFSQYLSWWNIQSDPYTDCHDTTKANTIYDTLNTMDDTHMSHLGCSLLPIHSNLNWDFHILSTTAITDASDDTSSTSSSCDYRCHMFHIFLILFGNICTALFVGYCFIQKKYKKLEQKMEQTKDENNYNLKRMDIKEGEISPKEIKTSKHVQRPSLVMYDGDGQEDSLASLPTIPCIKRSNTVPYRMSPQLKPIRAIPEAYAVSELEDSILNSDFNDGLHEVLKKIKTIDIKIDTNDDEDDTDHKKEDDGIQRMFENNDALEFPDINKLKFDFNEVSSKGLTGLSALTSSMDTSETIDSEDSKSSYSEPISLPTPRQIIKEAPARSKSLRAIYRDKIHARVIKCTSPAVDERIVSG